MKLSAVVSSVEAPTKQRTPPSPLSPQLKEICEQPPQGACW
jgi:hypothetical protein